MRLIFAQARMASPVNFGSDFDLRYCVGLPANSLVRSSSDAISASVSCVISVSFITFHRTIVNAHTILYSLT